MKILFFSTLESTGWGGSEQLWSDVALRLQEQGHSVMTCTLKWPETHSKLQEIQQAGGKLVLRPNVHIPKPLIGRIQEKIQGTMHGGSWKDEVAAFKPDMVYINEGGTFDNALHIHGDWLRSLGVPFYILSNVCKEFGTLEPEERQYFPGLFDAAEQIFFVSQRNLDVAERMMARAIPNSTVIKNPIRIKEVPSRYPDETVYNMAVVARVETAVKGFDTLIETFAQPQWKDRNYVVNIYGSGPDKDYLQDLIKFRGLENKIIFKGFVNNVAQIWEENHLLLMPSRMEGTPLSLLEAGYCSRAALVTDVGGNAVVIEDGVNGFVAGAPVIKSFSQAMERAWEQRTQWKQLGINAKQKLEREHPADAVTSMIELIGL